MSEKGLKVLNVVAENFKNIDKTEVDFAGRSAIIVGKNGAGKSSLIQAICSPIDSNYIPAKPIKEGEERGSIELTIGGNLHGEEETYTLGMYFSDKHKKGRITITNSDGEKVNGGKQLISDIVGNIGFDIQDFIKLGVTSSGGVSKPGVQQQIQILKGLMPIDVLRELHRLDKEYDEKYDKRTGINKDISYAKTKLEGHEYSQEELELYSEEKDTAEIASKMSNIEKELDNYNKVKFGVEQAEAKIPALETAIEHLQQKLATAKLQLEDEKSKLTKGNKWLEGKSKPSIDELNKELAFANEFNKKVREIKSLEEDQKALRDLETVSGDLTTRLSEIKDKKKEIFSLAPLPVKGLTFDDDGIYFNGLPFVEGQHPSSTILGIGAKIGMAMNPNLKLLIIRDGSLLDEKTTKWLINQCEKNDYQLLIERVADNEEVDIQFVERDA